MKGFTLISRIFRADSKSKNQVLLYKSFKKPKSVACINKDSNSGFTLLELLVKVFGISCTFVIICKLVVPAIITYSTAEKVMFTVKEKEPIAAKKGKYLIFTKQEVFENTDSFWKAKFNSSDVYGQLEPGKTYEAEVYGWRVPFLSWYRNIVWIKEKS